MFLIPASIDSRALGERRCAIRARHIVAPKESSPIKHMVRMQLTPQAGHDIEARPGGPGPVMSRLIERFKPEMVYMSPARRELFVVCDLNPADMAELMIAGCQVAGQYPEFIPVIDGKEFGAIVGKAIPAAKKLIEG
jgi:hypothetical protein